MPSWPSEGSEQGTINFNAQSIYFSSLYVSIIESRNSCEDESELKEVGFVRDRTHATSYALHSDGFCSDSASDREEVHVEHRGTHNTLIYFNQVVFGSFD
jgi:hypothetical protein